MNVKSFTFLMVSIKQNQLGLICLSISFKNNLSAFEVSQKNVQLNIVLSLKNVYLNIFIKI